MSLKAVISRTKRVYEDHADFEILVQRLEELKTN
jgi:hypothetical protein